MIGPDATVTLDFALARLTGLIDRLIVYPETMKRNLELLGGLHNSQRVLLALTQAGMIREDAYAVVQRNAMAVWQMRGDRAGAFAQLLKADAEIAARLSAADIDAMFDDFYHLKHVDALFERVFGPGA
jgi:adenylosuccinate lyase